MRKEHKKMGPKYYTPFIEYIIGWTLMICGLGLIFAAIS